MRIIVLLLLIPVAGCLEIPGGEGAPCNQHGLCGPNLVCNQDNRCVKPGSNDCNEVEEGLCYNAEHDPIEYDCGWFIKPQETDHLSGMCKVPAGDYPIGEAGTETSTGAFYLDRFEVTNRRYLNFLNNKAGGTAGFVPTCDPDPVGKSWTEDPLGYKPGEDDHPVVCVTFEQARAFCQWAGKRLPDADEWEAGARGMGAGPYPWAGNSFLNLANCFDEVCHDTYPAGTCQSSSTVCADTAPEDTLPDGSGPFGHRHMAGNVSEWTADPDGFIRGGSWDDGDTSVDPHTCEELKVWWSRDPAYSSAATVGFRCALSH